MGFQISACPSRSPWGQIDHAKQEAPGIWFVSTPGHGGFLLSAERMAALPAWARFNNAARQKNAFEEDCEWALVVLAFQAEFPPDQVLAAQKSVRATAGYDFPGFNATGWKQVAAMFPVGGASQTQVSQGQLALEVNA